MALIHEFLIIDENFEIDNLQNYLERVEISDSIINCISDSLSWFTTFWNNSTENQGLNYYGYSIVEVSSLAQFSKILKNWKDLFSNATDEFIITGDYLFEEDRYEKINFKKVELID